MERTNISREETNQKEEDSLSSLKIKAMFKPRPAVSFKLSKIYF